MENVWKWIAGLGGVLAVTGIVALIWMQIDLPGTPFGSSAIIRWQEATLPLVLTAMGLLVVTAALILRTIETRAQPN